MKSSDLRPDHIRALRAQLARWLSYLRRLHERMQALRFPSDDTLYAAVHRSLLCWEDLDGAAITRWRGTAWSKRVRITRRAVRVKSPAMLVVVSGLNEPRDRCRF